MVIGESVFVGNLLISLELTTTADGGGTNRLARSIHGHCATPIAVAVSLFRSGGTVTALAGTALPIQSL